VNFPAHTLHAWCGAPEPVWEKQANGYDDISAQARFETYNEKRASISWTLVPPGPDGIYGERRCTLVFRGKFSRPPVFTRALHEPELPRLIRQGRPTLLREWTSRPMERGDHPRGDPAFCWNHITADRSLRFPDLTIDGCEDRSHRCSGSAQYYYPGHDRSRNFDTQEL